MNLITSFLVFVCVLTGLAIGHWLNPYLAIVFFAAAIVIVLSLKMANAWQKFVILRLSKLQNVKGPGMFTSNPVNVEAISFWHVHDALALEAAQLLVTA